MRIISNDKLINRNKRIGQFLTFGSLIILAGGMYLSFRNTSQTITLSFIALVLGFVLSQVGIFYGNRWGRRPRPDEVLATSLKGLDDRYTLYNYTAPVPHLLIGPAGMWNLIPYFQAGKITFEKGKWKQRGGNWYLKLFAQEGLGRPDMEATANLNDLHKFITAKLPDSEIDPQVVLVFYNEKATIEAEDSPTPALPAKKLKEFIRKHSKEYAMTMEQVEAVEEAIEGPIEEEVPAKK